MIIRMFFQSVGPLLLLLLLVQLEEDGELEKNDDPVDVEDAEEDSLGILESAVEENKLNTEEEESDGDFSTVPRAALSFGNSSIKFM